MHLITPCGRYGKEHGEPFLRRRTTKEPQETPRRYYETDEEYDEGREASAAAWQVWKEETLGDADVGQIPWFELVDHELRQISSLINGDQHDFQQGIQKLERRVAASDEANGLLAEDQRIKNLPKDERDELREVTRRGPPLLARILKDLKGNSRREDAMQKLTTLCDDVSASKTMRPPLSMQPSYLNRSSQRLTRQRLSHRVQSGYSQQYSPPRTRISTHIQGEEVGLAHDLGKVVLATAIPAGNKMHAPSVAPTDQSSRSSRPTNVVTPSRNPAPRTNAWLRLTHTRALRPSQSASRLQTLRSPPTVTLPSRAANPAQPSLSRTPTTSLSTLRVPATSSRAHPLSHRLPLDMPPTYITRVPEATAQSTRCRTATPSQQTGRLAAPAPPSAQTILYMEGLGTKPPTYIPSISFLAENGEEHGEERAPGYQTMAPTIPPPAQWMPRAAMGEDVDEMRMEGRQGMEEPRRTMQPSSMPRATNGIGGGTATRR